MSLGIAVGISCSLVPAHGELLKDFWMVQGLARRAVLAEKAGLVWRGRQEGLSSLQSGNRSKPWNSLREMGMETGSTGCHWG